MAAAKSLLTRRVFRRLILSQPVVQHPQHRRAHTRLQSRPAAVRHGRLPSSVVAVPRRTFIGGIFGSGEDTGMRDFDRPRMDAGMQTMLELDKRLHLKARLPSRKFILSALRQFTALRITTSTRIEDLSAGFLLQTLNALETHSELLDDLRSAPKPEALEVTAQDLKSLFVALAPRGADEVYTEQHTQLASLAWEMLQTRSSDGPKQVPETLIRILCSTGQTSQARQLVEQHGATQSLDFLLLAGYAREDNEEALREITARMVEQNEVTRPVMHRTLAVYYARKGNMAVTKEWLTYRALYRGERDHDNLVPSCESVYRELAALCMRESEKTWARSLIDAIDDAKTLQNVRRATVEAAVSHGATPEQVGQMIEDMVRSSKVSALPEDKPIIHVFNGLFCAAVTSGNTQVVDTFPQLLADWQVRPDAETYMLQIDHWLRAGDVRAALEDYAHLRNVGTSKDQDWATINSLLQAVAAQPDADAYIVAGLVHDLSTRPRPFPAPTMLALCNYHLRRNEWSETVDLLQTYAYQLGTRDRITLRDNLVRIARLDGCSAAGTWQLYEIVSKIFDVETRRDVRTVLMATLFDKGDAERAYQVFDEMYEHARADSRPDEGTYAAAFRGIVATRSARAFEVVRNKLRLDTDVDLSTRLRNGLLLCHSRCGNAGRALEVWHDITRSAEGPDHTSLQCYFLASQYVAERGAVSSVWQRLETAGVGITPGVFNAYATWLAVGGQFAELRELLGRAHAVTGEPLQPKFKFLHEADQTAFAAWCADDYPAEWAQVEAMGFRPVAAANLDYGVQASLHSAGHVPAAEAGGRRQLDGALPALDGLRYVPGCEIWPDL